MVGLGPGLARVHILYKGALARERGKQMSLPVGTPASGSQMMASTCKAALAVFCEYDAQLGAAELRRERDALKQELALFGTAVGCCADGVKCSNCNAESSDCQCRAWTCRCYACWLMRRTYKKAHRQGLMVDAAGIGSAGFFRMVDDSSDDERFAARLRKNVPDKDQVGLEMQEALLRE